MWKSNKVVRRPNKNTLMATVSMVPEVSKLRVRLVVLNPKWYVGDRRANLIGLIDYQHALMNVTIAQDLSHVPFASDTLIHC